MRHCLISTSHPIRRYHNNMKRILTALVLSISILFASGGFVFAQDFLKGVEAWEKGDFATALREWSALAEQGNTLAQFSLGWLYEDGRGVTQNHKEAVKWYRKAAEQGYEDAQFNLGLMYSQGKGVLQDYKEAVKWYRKAAEQGFEDAQFNLGVMYMNGQGVLQNNIYAYIWVNIAASSGNAGRVKIRDIIAKKMKSADIFKAQKLARECVKKNYKGC